MKTFIQDTIRDIYHEHDCPYAKRLAKENTRKVDEDYALERELIPCKHCQSLNYIFHSGMDSYVSKMRAKHLSYMLNGNWLLVQTDISFWKIGYDRYSRDFFLFHGNTAPADSTVEVHEKNEYHRQADVMHQDSIAQYLDYIYEHDRFRRGDYSHPPRGTRKQRNKCARARANLKRAERARVYELIDKISANKTSTATA
ncbi:MAG: hypothetical protein J6Z43_06475 [Clostridiales bacterium]|nr:hypothetical protein [Clostridiales bacterium]